MNPKSRYVLSCLAIGILAVTLLAFLGFWARWLCFNTLGSLTSQYSQEVSISPMGLLPDEIEKEPNVVAASEAALTIRQPGPPPHMAALGVSDYFYRFLPGTAYSDLYHWDSQTNGPRLYFERRQGLFVLSKVETRPSAERENQRQRIQLYAGPDGIAEAPDKNLGRFRSPIVGVWGTYLLVYDEHEKRFLGVDFEDRKVVKGPQLDPAEDRRPVRVGVISERPSLFSWRVEPPLRKWDPNEPRPRPGMLQVHRNHEVVPGVQIGSSLWPSPYAFVLDASGRIDLLERETLQFAGGAGSLPWVPEYFDPKRMPTKPELLLAYDVRPVLTPADGALSKWQYHGLLGGAYNRDGTHISLVAFNSQGAQVGGAGQRLLESRLVPGGPMVITTRYLLENLHPPVLLLLSYFTGPYWPAGAGHRSIFVLPDSFVGMKGRDLRRLPALRFIDALVIMLPAVALALTLAALVARDAQVVGFSKDARALWILITIAFGLPAYVTYRWTRPQATLVTCANCGRPRRPDLDRCHRCNSPWDMPELEPPAWRVLDQSHLQLSEGPLDAEHAAND